MPTPTAMSDRGAQVGLEDDQHGRDSHVDAELLQVLVGVQSPALPLDGQGRRDQHAGDLGQLGWLELGESERYPAAGTASHDAVPVGEHQERRHSPTTPGSPVRPWSRR